MASSTLEDVEPLDPARLTCMSLRRLRPDLVDVLFLEEGAELHRLREEHEHLRAELDRFAAAAGLARRREAVASLLAEFQLPPPESREPAARAITSDLFFQSLLSAPDEASVRRLVEERAELVSGVRRGMTPSAGLPSGLSRGRRASAYDEPLLDTRSFVRAIRG